MTRLDTEALGILVVHIHRATGVKGMDLDGQSGKSILTSADRNH